MKKLLALFAAIALVMTLTACGGEAKLPADGEITMENIDMYLGRDGAQYIDLRNLEDRLRDGYVSGFSVIPYFNYLNNEEIITGKADTTTVVDQDRVEQLFDKDAPAIFLMCASGGRAGWVKTALEGLGYENVYNVGGFKDYAGENKVLGDGSYNLDVPVYGDLTPGQYVAAADEADSHNNLYFVVLTVNENGGIENVYVDAVVGDDGDTKQIQGDDYGMLAYSDPTAIAEWYVQANTLAAAIVENQGWDDAWATDGLAGVSVGTDEIKEAFDAALALATPAS